LKWVLAHQEVTLAMVGADDPAQLANSVRALDDLRLGEEDEVLLAKVRATVAYREYEARKRAQFGYGERP
jgi:aryl-alcohol dehydrogenase-like predicted oxidoreductase